MATRIDGLWPTMVLACVAPMMLAGCGGGSSYVRGGFGQPPPPPPPTTPPPPAVTTVPCPAPVTGECVIEAVSRPTWDEFGMTGGRQSDHRLFVHGGSTGGGWINLRDGDYRFSRTEISGTSLVVWDTLASDVFIYKDYTGLGFIGTSELWLTGMVRGNVVNEEILRLSHRCGTGLNLCTQDRPRRIEGNYTQAASGTMIAVLGDPLTITGTATLDGLLLLAGGSSASWVLPTASTSIRVLSADGGVSGTFDAWAREAEAYRPLFLEGGLRYTANEVFFDATRVSFSSAMASSGASALHVEVGARLDDAMRLGDALQGLVPGSLHLDQQRFLTSSATVQYLDSLDQARRTFDSLSGRAHALAPRMIDRQLLDLAAGVGRELDALPGTQSGAGWARPIEGGGHVGGWQSVSGFSAGQDYRLDGGWRAGAGVAELASRTQLDALGGAIDSRMPIASLHARYEGAGWQATGVVAYAEAELDVRRPIELGRGAASLAGSERSLRQHRAYAEVRRHFTGAAGTLAPFVGVDYLREHAEAFREQGVTGLELVAGASRRQAWSGVAGLHFAKDWALPGQGRVGLDMDVRYRQALDGEATPLRAAFTGAPGAPFDVASAWAPSPGMLRLGLAGEVRSGWLWALDYERSLGAGWDERGWGLRMQWPLGTGSRPPAIHRVR